MLDSWIPVILFSIHLKYFIFIFNLKIKLLILFHTNVCTSINREIGFGLVLALFSMWYVQNLEKKCFPQWTQGMTQSGAPRCFQSPCLIITRSSRPAAPSLDSEVTFKSVKNNSCWWVEKAAKPIIWKENILLKSPTYRVNPWGGSCGWPQLYWPLLKIFY